MDAALKEFVSRLGYVFENVDLLNRALRHASLDIDDNNERLEFLGDRVLGLVIAGLILEKYPSEREGDLARRLADLVSRRVCAEIAHEIGLSGAMRCDPGQKDKGAPARNILANGCEAVLGAVYLDGGIQAAERVISRLWHIRLEAQTSAPIDAKTSLQEWVMKRKLNMPVYQIIAQSGPAHAPTFRVSVSVGDTIVEGAGPSRRLAEQSAAAKCLDVLLQKPEGNA